MQTIFVQLRRLLLCTAAVSFVAVFGAFLTQLYGAPPTAPATHGEKRWRRAFCAAKLSSLQLELQEHFAQAALAFDQPLSSKPPRGWFDTFATRLDAASTMCGGSDDAALRQAVVAMQTLEKRFATALDNVTDDSAALRASLRRLTDSVRY